MFILRQDGEIRVLISFNSNLDWDIFYHVAIWFRTCFTRLNNYSIQSTFLQILRLFLHLISILLDVISSHWKLEMKNQTENLISSTPASLPIWLNQHELAVIKQIPRDFSTIDRGARDLPKQHAPENRFADSQSPWQRTVRLRGTQNKYDTRVAALRIGNANFFSHRHNADSENIRAPSALRLFPPTSHS